ncbi:MFS transporter [Elioraea rosea]|uniref:MFS transporter n=1 Tax=Elioraea rosea TaxID=2492390 RepID=UPI00118269D1|nr:MFS transporter [Elioraea rosea]
MGAETTIERPAARDALVIALIGAAHFISHFTILAIPPLFPMMREELGVSYAALGGAVAILSAVTALGQTPIGVWVDRTGAAPWLIGGTLLMAAASIGMGLAPGWWWFLAAALVSGLGNATIHPADYAILAGSVSQERMGRAFSLHTAAGYAGFAAAPAVSIGFEALFGWRGALIAVGLMSAPVVLALVLFRRVFRSDIARHANTGSPVRVLTARPILLLFAFMTLLAMGGSGVQTFLVTVLPEIHGVTLAAAAAALTAWLLGSTGGTLLGGWLADRTARHATTVAIMLLGCATLVAALGVVPMGAVGLIVTAAVAGVMLGVLMPARDMLVRKAAPPGTTGQVFGFVSAGLPLGQAIVPAPLGALVDMGRPGLTLVVSALCLAAAVFTAGTAQAARVAAQPAE